MVNLILHAILFSFVYYRQNFYWTCLSVSLLVSYQKQELRPIREHPFMMEYVLLIFLVFCVVFLFRWWSFWALYAMLPVSLDSPLPPRFLFPSSSQILIKKCDFQAFTDLMQKNKIVSLLAFFFIIRINLFILMTRSFFMLSSIFNVRS